MRARHLVGKFNLKKRFIMRILLTAILALSLTSTFAAANTSAANEKKAHCTEVANTTNECHNAPEAKKQACHQGVYDQCMAH